MLLTNFRSHAARQHGAVVGRRLLSSATKYPAEWTKRALKELRGKELSALEITTPEGLKMKPMYTKDDVDYDAVSQEPGVFPYTRGCVQPTTNR